MMINVTDKGLPAHLYSKSCKCRGCVAVRKAKIRAGLISLPAALVAGGIIGWIGGKSLGPLASIAAGLIAVGIFTRFSPSEEVLKPDDINDSE